jgi:hypothetical protein
MIIGFECYAKVSSLQNAFSSVVVPGGANQLHHPVIVESVQIWYA